LCANKGQGKRSPEANPTLVTINEKQLAAADADAAQQPASTSSSSDDESSIKRSEGVQIQQVGSRKINFV
jgi:hypothetical protein